MAALSMTLRDWDLIKPGYQVMKISTAPNEGIIDPSSFPLAAAIKAVAEHFVELFLEDCPTTGQELVLLIKMPCRLSQDGTEWQTRLLPP